jgi:hypothetical protein
MNDRHAYKYIIIISSSVYRIFAYFSKFVILKMFIKKILIPYAIGFTATAFLLPEQHFAKIAYQFYHL